MRLPAAVSHGLFVTGTDTGVGKTRVSCALLRQLNDASLRCVGMKPVASGCEQGDDGVWRNEDALALQAASTPRPPYALVNPYPLPLATAPDIAAEAAGVRISLARLRECFDSLRSEGSPVLVEGVGGWLAPLFGGLMQSALAAELRLPVVLVVGLRLGCLNHALLSERAIIADGLPLLGWIGSAVDPLLEHADAYRSLLRSHLRAPCLGMLEHGAERITPEPGIELGSLIRPAGAG